jgi:hypothetical protein
LSQWVIFFEKPIDFLPQWVYNIIKEKNETHKNTEVIIMTKAMKRKFEEAVKNFHNEHPGEYVHGCYFHHYGEDYRIESNPEETEFKIYRSCAPYDIHDILIEEVTA